MDTVQYSDESLYGNKYFYNIMDAYSRYGVIIISSTITNMIIIFNLTTNS